MRIGVARHGPERALLTAALLAGSALPAAAFPGPGFLFGQPPDPAAAAVVAPAAIDSLDVARWTDQGTIFLEDLVGRLAGADAARLDVDGLVRPVDLTGSGRGRLPLSLDGLAAGGGVIHWDNFSWLPLRALATGAVDRAPSTAWTAGGGDGSLRLATRSPGDRPTSTVVLTGGSFGHRLAELDFARRFNRVAFHADVATFSHTGFVSFGENSLTRGFVKLDFPLAGWDISTSAALASGRLRYLSSFSDAGQEQTRERRLAAVFTRPVGLGTARITLLRHSSTLETDEGVPGPFTLGDSRWQGGVSFATTPGAGLNWSAGVEAGTEKRAGLLPADASFQGASGVFRLDGPLRGAWRWAGRMTLREQEPTGLSVEPAGELRGTFAGGRRLWLQAGRATGIPTLLLHLDQPWPDREALVRLVSGLERLERPESHWSFGGGAAVGRSPGPPGAPGARLGASLYAGATRVADSPGLLLAVPLAYLSPVDEPFWTGRVDVSAHWIPRAELTFLLSAGWRSFDPVREPYLPRLRGEGSVTLRRVYFKRDLDLSVTAAGRLVGSRRALDGYWYPTQLTGSVALTGVIRTLTLFWRIENVGDLYIESDLRDSDYPVALPGLHNRIGATLRLLD